MARASRARRRCDGASHPRRRRRCAQRAQRARTGRRVHAAGARDGVIHVTLDVAQESIQRRAVLYDKDGDAHYDTISAFIKSVRGSDPDAALYWLAKMLYAGEDPRFILRRLVILAGEDIGLADPMGLVVANAADAGVRVHRDAGRHVPHRRSHALSGDRAQVQQRRFLLSRAQASGRRRQGPGASASAGRHPRRARRSGTARAISIRTSSTATLRRRTICPMRSRA